jgi:uncharacterized protein (DUF2235 family)
MPRNLVLFCDGTDNEFGEQNTNVVRLLQSLVRDDPNQLVYYDPGVGTMAAPGPITRLGKAISRAVDLAFGTGFDDNVRDAYIWLMNNWQPGDVVYLFGFSRGSYTARVVAGMLHHIGLLPPHLENLVPYALRLMLVTKRDNRAIGDEFRRTFSRPTTDPDRRIRVHFIGVWDTVASVGFLWDPARYGFTKNNPGVDIIRHAISIDERRAFYRENRFERAFLTQDLKQLWFAGVHSDIGGGYNDSRLWQPPFFWIAGEAKDAGLRIDDRALAAAVGELADKPWLEKQHNEYLNPKLAPLWYLCEILPKMPRPGRPHMNLFRARRLVSGRDELHESALRRIHDDPRYNPANLSKAFRESVRALEQIPPSQVYDDGRGATPAQAGSPA